MQVASTTKLSISPPQTGTRGSPPIQIKHMTSNVGDQDR